MAVASYEERLALIRQVGERYKFKAKMAGKSVKAVRAARPKKRRNSLIETRTKTTTLMRLLTLRLIMVRLTSRLRIMKTIGVTTNGYD
jgi:hypothetical protein